MARPGLSRHRKFSRLTRLLGSAALARGHLELLWDVAYENGEDYLGDASDVEHLSHWQGEPGALAAALVDSGFVDFVPGEGGGYRVHDLLDHAPDYVANRRRRESERKMDKTCERCRTQFRSPDPKAKYCCNSCRSAAWRDAANADERTRTNCNDTPAPAPAPAQPSVHSQALDRPLRAVGFKSGDNT